MARNSEAYKRLELQLDPELDAAITAAASSAGVTRAEVVRAATRHAIKDGRLSPAARRQIDEEALPGGRLARGGSGRGAGRKAAAG